MPRIESRLDGRYSDEAANKQACSDQQHHCEGNLRRCQKTSSTLASAAAARAPGAFPKTRLQIRAGCEKRGREAEDETCGNGKQQRKTQHPNVDANLARLRQT